MQRLLAIDGDSQELFFVVAHAEAEQITLETAGVVSLKNTSDDSPVSNEERGKRLQAALGRSKRPDTKVLLGVDRSSIELLKFAVPPANDTELAELVLNQVETEASNGADDAVVDYSVGPGSDTESRKVVAAVFPRSQFQQLTELFSAAGLAANRMLVRPYAIASLFVRLRPGTLGATLLVNATGIDVDLVVVEDSRAVFFRSVKLPTGIDDDPGRQRLQQEIRRTLLVAPQSGDVAQAIKNVVVFGTSPAHQELIQQLSSDGSITGEAIDPLDCFQRGEKCQMPKSGHMAPVLGMLVAETSGTRHPIDFLQPKKPARPVNQRQRMAAVIAAAVLIAGIGQYFIWERFAEADEEIKVLSEELKDLEKRVKKTAERRQIAESIQEWNKNGIVWLDELRSLSANLPSGQELVVQRLNATTARGGKGAISFQGRARDPKVITQMETDLRDNRHEVQTPRVEERQQEKSFPWSFETSVTVSAVKSKIEIVSGDDEAKSKGQR